MPKIPEGQLSPKQEKKATATLIALWEHDTIPDAAAALGISRVQVYERIKRYGLTEKLAEMREAGQLVLMQGTQKAAGNLVDKLASKDEKISIQASTEILDRVGITKPNINGTLAQSNNFIQVNNNYADRYKD